MFSKKLLMIASVALTTSVLSAATDAPADPQAKTGIFAEVGASTATTTVNNSAQPFFATTQRKTTIAPRGRVGYLAHNWRAYGELQSQNQTMNINPLNIGLNSKITGLQYGAGADWMINANANSHWFLGGFVAQQSLKNATVITQINPPPITPSIFSGSVTAKKVVPYAELGYMHESTGMLNGLIWEIGLRYGLLKNSTTYRVPTTIVQQTTTANPFSVGFDLGYVF